MGALLVQIAKQRGARVFGTASTKHLGIARDAGADLVIDYVTADFEDEVMRATDGRGVDVVYDSVGRTTFDKSLAVLTRRGMLVRRLTDDDRPKVLSADRAATGEDRVAVIDHLRPLRGVAIDDGMGVMGFAVASAWGSGAAIIGRDEDVGLALMSAAAAGPEPATLIVPDTNPVAAEAVRRWGFARVDNLIHYRGA